MTILGVDLVKGFCYGLGITAGYKVAQTLGFGVEWLSQRTLAEQLALAVALSALIVALLPHLSRRQPPQAGGPSDGAGSR